MNYNSILLKKKELLISLIISIISVFIGLSIDVLHYKDINSIISLFFCCMEYFVWLIFYESRNKIFLCWSVLGVSMFFSIKGPDLFPKLFNINPFFILLILIFASFFKFLLLTEQEKRLQNKKEIED